MNFQGMNKIEDSKFFIDLAFRRANERSSQLRGSKSIKGTRLEKSKKMEILKIDTINAVISDRLLKTLKSFPELDTLPEFYRELINCTLEYPKLKKSLGALNWARKKSHEMHSHYVNKIKNNRI